MTMAVRKDRAMVGACGWQFQKTEPIWKRNMLLLGREVLLNTQTREIIVSSFDGL